MRRRFILVGISLMLIPATAASHRASAEEPPAVSLSAESIDLSSSPAEIVVLNNSVSAWSIDIQASLEEDAATSETEPGAGVPLRVTVGTDSSDNSRNPSRPARLRDVQLSAPSAADQGTLTIQIEVVEGAPRGTGALVLTATPAEIDGDLTPLVLRGDISTAPGDAVPAVTEATGRSWSGPEVSAYVPLASAGPCPPVPGPESATTTEAQGPPSTASEPDDAGGVISPTTTIARMTLTDGDHAETATVTCGTSNASGRDAVLQVTATDIEQGDELTGTLKLGDEAVVITLSRSAGLWVAIIVMGLGFSLAYAVRWLLDLLRPKRVLESRVSAARIAVSRAQRAFEAALKAVVPARKDPCVTEQMALKGPERHRLDQDKIDCELKALRTRLQELKLGAGLSVSERSAKEMSEISKAVDLISALADKWPSLATTLRVVHSEVEKSRPLLVVYAPTLLASAQELLAPSRFTQYSSAEAEELLKETQSLSAVFKLIPTIDELARVAGADRPPLSKAFADRLSEAQARLNAVLSSLRVTTTAAPLVTNDLAKEVETIRTLLAGLPPITMVYDAEEAEELAYLEESAPGGRRLAAIVNLQPRVPEATVPVPPNTPSVDRPVDWADLAQRSNMAINSIDGVLFLVAVGLSLWTGLSTYYFDHAWGTWLDAATLFFWAVGTTTVLSTIFDAAKRFGDRRFVSTVSAETTAPAA